MPGKSTREAFLKKAIAIHGDIYDYSHVEYKTTHENVEIICRIHGSFFQTPHNHMQGKGCPRCKGHIRLTQEEFLEKSRAAHGDKYDYSKAVYKNNSTKVIIICPYHGEFTQIPMAHMKGVDCPVCGNANRSVTIRNSVGHIDKIRAGLMKSLGVENPMQDSGARKRNFEALRENGHGSKLEESLYEKLCNKFGRDDVVWQYFSDEYPFECDFYVKSRHMYIELNAYWTHEDHWYDENSAADRRHLAEIRGKTGQGYERNAAIWSVEDVKKREAARQNNLNYVVFWDKYGCDADDWFHAGCPDRKDWQ